MSDGAIVEVVSDSSGKDQFGKTLTYRNGEPRKKRLVWISVGLITLVLVPALVSGPPSEETVVSSTEVFSIPMISSVSPSLDLPEYNRNEDLRAQDEAKKTARQGGGEKPITLSGPQLLSRPRAVKIPPGAMVKAQLTSGASNGLVKAEIKEALVINGETLIDAGTVAVGNGSSSDSRLYIKFNRLVYRDGTTDTTQGEAADESDKTVGLKGSRIGYHAVRLAAGIGLNFAGGVAEGLQETEGQQGVVVKKPTVKNALLNGAAKASLDQSREMMSSLKNEAPVIEIPEGQTFYILFSDSGG